MAEFLLSVNPGNVVRTGYCLHEASKAGQELQKVYARALPHLGVNGKIKHEWRTLPDRYQGLALPNFPLVTLVDKVSFLLENWCLKGQAQSDVLAMAYKNLVVRSDYTRPPSIGGIAILATSRCKWKIRLVDLSQLTSKLWHIRN